MDNQLYQWDIARQRDLDATNERGLKLDEENKERSFEEKSIAMISRKKRTEIEPHSFECSHPRSREGEEDLDRFAADGIEWNSVEWCNNKYKGNKYAIQ